jgi:hypothetical protein
MGLINEIAHALPWPYTLRTVLGVLAIIVSINVIVIWLAVARTDRTATM